MADPGQLGALGAAPVHFPTCTYTGVVIGGAAQTAPAAPPASVAMPQRSPIVARLHEQTAAVRAYRRRRAELLADRSGVKA